MAAGRVPFAFAGLFILSIVNLGQSLSLPYYLKGCSRNDPNINECALKSGREGLNNVLNGDKKYRIPNYKPLRITQIVVDQGGGGAVGLRSDLNDVAIYGFDKIVLNAVRYRRSAGNLAFPDG
uniref:Uncharacterized protein n=1 Tax=Timema bartmani TaxID=61472 RepID=A0A7R9FAQ5_9NEOP|nr:unnamed protein product [Timema bartmani]